MMFKKLFAAALLVGALGTGEAAAQVKAGAFGIGGEFTAGASTKAMLLYTPSSNFQIDLGIGLMNRSFKVADGATARDGEMSLSFELGGKYFINSNNVSPFIGLAVGYGMEPKIKSTSGSTVTETEGNTIMIMPSFGAQAMLAKDVAIFAKIGLGFNIHTDKTTTTIGTVSASGETGTTDITLGGSALGVSFYF